MSVRNVCSLPLRAAGRAFLEGLIPILLCLIACFPTSSVQAQLDSVHYLPPMFCRGEIPNTNDLVMSTLETTPFLVSAFDGQGNFLGSDSVSKTDPGIISLGGGTNAQLIVEEDSLNTVLTNEGIYLTGSKTFTVNLRGESDNHGYYLASKGQAAFGEIFRLGFAFQGNGGNVTRGFSAGFMATENNTQITVTNPHGNSFYGSGTGTPAYSSTFTLNAGESYVIGAHILNGTDPTPNNASNDFNGTLVTSTKPIAISVGNNQTGSATGSFGRDMGFDQIVPIETVGEEYVLVEGDGGQIGEFVIIVATAANTDVFVNGAFNTNLTNAGDYQILGVNSFSANENMFIETSEPTYIYQTVSSDNCGFNCMHTNGLVFVPPISCLSPTEVVIPEPNYLADGIISIITSAGASLTVVGGGTVAGPTAVTGTANWETWKITNVPNSTEAVEISSTDPMAVQILDLGGNAGVAGYYSGFGVNARILAEGECVGDTTEFIAAGSDPDSVIWDFGDGTILVDTTIFAEHLYAAADTYTVQLVAFYTCITDTAYKDIIITPLPNAGFNFANACFGDEVQFQDTSTTSQGIIFERLWVFGDGDSATNANPTNLYPNDTLYEVKLGVTTDIGCTDTATAWVETYSLPTADFTMPNACFGDSSDFVDLSVSNNSGNLKLWRWDVDGDSITDIFSLGDTGYLFADTGIFEVQLVVIDTFGCRDTVNRTTDIHSLPSSNFGFDPVCFGDTLFFSDSSTIDDGAITTWIYDYGDGSIPDTNQNPGHVFPDTGFYTVTLTTISDSGCFNPNAGTQQIEIYKLPTPDFTWSPVCFNDTMYLGDNSTTLSGTVDEWLWDFGDGDSSMLTNPGHVFPDDTLFLVTLIATSDLGCSDTTSQWVENYQLPVPQGALENVCEFNTGTITDATLTPNGFGIATYSWDVYDDGTVESTDSSFQVHYPAWGDFPVKLTVMDSFGCSNTGVDTVFIHPKPNAGFTSGNVCLGAPTFFFDTSSVAQGINVAWTWTLGDSTTDTIQNPQHFYPAAGTYPVTMIVESDSGCLDTTNGIVDIVIFPLPQSEFTWNGFCHNDSTQFTDITTIQSGSITSWLWSFGDGVETDTVQNPSFVYSGPGIYEVVLLAQSDKGCSKAGIDTIEIFELPTVNFSSENVCLNEQMVFTNQSTIGDGVIGAWDWDFEDGNSSSLQDPSHLYAQADTFSVKLVATTDSTFCSDSLTQDYIVYHLPDVNFTASNVCEDSVAFLVNQSASPNLAPADAWHWDLSNDGTIDYTVSDTNHVFAQPGTYDIEFWVRDTLTCRDSLVQQIVIHPRPDAAFLAPNVCFGDNTFLQDQSTVLTGNIITWDWTVSDGATFAIQNPVHTLTVPDTFDVELIVSSDSGCVSSPVTGETVLYPEPVAAFTSADVCAYDSVKVVNQSTIDAWGVIDQVNWDFGDGFTSNEPDSTFHSYASFGLYSITLAVESQDGCTDTAVQVREIFPVPDASFSTSPVCEAKPYTFPNSSFISAGAIIDYQWDFGDNTTGSGRQPTHTYFGLDTFDVQLITTSDRGCVDSVTNTIYTFSVPVPGFFFDSSCAQNGMPFYDTTTNVSGRLTDWEWDFGDGDTVFGFNPVHTYDTGGVYNVTLTVTSVHNCQATITTPILVYDLPVVNFTANPIEGCGPLPVTFTNNSYFASGFPLTYEWTIEGDTVEYPFRDLNYVFENRSVLPQYRDISLKVSTELCSNSASWEDMIAVLPKPVADFTTNRDSASVFNGTFRFFDRASADALFYEWDFGDQLGTDVEANPVYQFDRWGTFSVMQMVENGYNCRDTASRNVYVWPESTYYVPSAFSPNGDGINDYFRGYGEDVGFDFLLQVFNRWGEVVFETSDPLGEWDGRIDGRPALEGVYIYKVHFKEEVTEQPMDFKGSVTLVRKHQE